MWKDQRRDKNEFMIGSFIFKTKKKKREEKNEYNW